jgi:excisionase family DNA binding protein
LPQTTKAKYLRTAQVAELLQVSPKTVSRWAQEGMLPYFRTLGGHRRYPDRESGPCWKPCPSHPRPASRASRLTAPAPLLSVASMVVLDPSPLDRNRSESCRIRDTGDLVCARQSGSSDDLGERSETPADLRGRLTVASRCRP